MKAAIALTTTKPTSHVGSQFVRCHKSGMPSIKLEKNQAIAIKTKPHSSPIVSSYIQRLLCQHKTIAINP